MFKEPDNLKMLARIKGDVEKAKRMASNSRNKLYTPQDSKLNSSLYSNRGDRLLLPALEPDYGITRDDKPKYFQDTYQAITCIYSTYDL